MLFAFSSVVEPCQQNLSFTVRPQPVHIASMCIDSPYKAYMSLSFHRDFRLHKQKNLSSGNSSFWHSNFRIFFSLGLSYCYELHIFFAVRSARPICIWLCVSTYDELDAFSFFLFNFIELHSLNKNGKLNHDYTTILILYLSSLFALCILKTCR